MANMGTRVWKLGTGVVGLLACGGQQPLASSMPATTGSGATSAASAKAPGLAAEKHGPLDVLEVAAGDYHTCARMGDGLVRCWGRNREGQVGDGTTTERVSPTPVDGLGPVAAITSGANFSCALLTDKTVRCWGKGATPGSTSLVLRPAPVAGLADVDQIDAGGIMICARLGSGKVTCWGSEPGLRAVVDAGAVEVSAAEAHACARMKDGTVRCWGDTPWTGGTPTLAHPSVSGSAVALTTGDSVACARTAGSGVVQCWGRNQQGELGRAPDTDLHDRAVAVPSTSGASHVAAGEAHICAVLSDTTVLCWGSNADGELGRGNRSASESPGPVPGLSGVVDLALGADHACARLTDATLRCWGSNSNGQLGDGTHDWRLAPTAVVW